MIVEITNKYNILFMSYEKQIEETSAGTYKRFEIENTDKSYHFFKFYRCEEHEGNLKKTILIPWDAVIEQTAVFGPKYIYYIYPGVYEVETEKREQNQEIFIFKRRPDISRSEHILMAVEGFVPEKFIEKNGIKELLAVEHTDSRYKDRVLGKWSLIAVPKTVHVIPVDPVYENGRIYYVNFGEEIIEVTYHTKKKEYTDDDFLKDLTNEYKNELEIVWLKPRTVDFNKFPLKESELFNQEKVEIFMEYKVIHRENAPAVIRYYKSGSKEREEWLINGLIHREDGPAWIEYYENGKKREEAWLINGEHHRIDGPAITRYYENGQKEYEIWYRNSRYHREDGPAEIRYYKNGQIQEEIWYRNGEMHREDGPAAIEYYDNGQKKSEIWRKNGKLHREDGPAWVMYYPNGEKNYEEWAVNDNPHREDGPAKITYYRGNQKRNEIWYRNGKPHRVDGPAWIEYYPNGETAIERYFINGKEITKEEEFIKYKKINNLIKEVRNRKKISL